MIPNFNLETNQISIWHVNLEQPADQRHELEELLSEDEVARAKAFYFERDQKRFVVARGVLRMLIGKYVDKNPRDVIFEYNAQGKPSLAGYSTLQFNVSHSHERAVYAFGCGEALGIDLEYMRLITDMDEIAQHTFSANENSVFNRVPKHLKQQAFFNCWTRKEAYIKALGEGLSHALDSFDVTLMPGEDARVLRVDSRVDLASTWTLKSFSLGENYVGALAIRQIVNLVNFHDLMIENC